MSPASLISACLAFAALPLFAAGEGTAPKNVELVPIPPVKWEEGEWSPGRAPQAVNGWTLKSVDSVSNLEHELYAEKDGRRVLLQSSGAEFGFETAFDGYWLVSARSVLSVIHAPEDGLPPRLIWCSNPKEFCFLEVATLRADGMELVLSVSTRTIYGNGESERRIVRIPLEEPVELDVECTSSRELLGVGIEHLPWMRVSPDGKWVSVSYGDSSLVCAVDVERRRVSEVMNKTSCIVYGGSAFSYLVGGAWGTDNCPAPCFLSIGDTYRDKYATVVWCDDLADGQENDRKAEYGWPGVGDADKGLYDLIGDYFYPKGDTPGEFIVTRPDGTKVRFPFQDCELARRHWNYRDDDSFWHELSAISYATCGDKLFSFGKQEMVTVGSDGVEGEEILLSDEELAAARARFAGEHVSPIYHASFTNGGALVAWFIVAPKSEGIAGRWHVRFYAQDGSIRRESVYDLPELPADFPTPESDGFAYDDFLTPQVVGDCAVIVTNTDGRGVHYRILSPTGEQDDVLLRSPKQLWLVKAGRFLLGITRGEDSEPSRIHFIPLEL